MHASVYELLSLRDDVVVDEAVAAPVRGGEECGTELERLRAVTAELRALPDQWPAPDRWGRIETALALNILETPQPGGKLRICEPAPAEKSRRPGWSVPLAAAATVTVIVAALTWQRGGKMEAPLTAQQAPIEFQEPLPAVEQTQTQAETPASAEQSDLAARSRELEQVLAAMPEEPAVKRAGTALTLAELQDRIRWVDHRLAMGEESGLESRQSEMLWQERVDLLNSLVAVRYAQARTSF